MVHGDAAAPAEAAAEEVPSLLTLPQSLLAAVLLLAGDGDAAALARNATVCRDFHALLRPWTHLTALRVASPGGRCPFTLAARGGSLQRLTVLADSGVGGGGELAVLAHAPLRHVELHGLAELAKASLLAVCVPTLETLQLVRCRADAAALVAALERCPMLHDLVVDDCSLGASPRDAPRAALTPSVCADRGACSRSSHAAVMRQLCGRAMMRLSMRHCCKLLNEATLEALALASPALAYLDVSGAEELCRVPEAVTTLRHLRELHAQDCGLRNQAFAPPPDGAAFFPALQALSLCGCRALGDAGVTALALLLRRPADASLSRLRLARLLDLDDSAATALLRARPAPLLALDVRCCGRLGDAFFAACCDARFCELRASGLPRLTPAMLLSLARSGALHDAHTIELDDCEALQRGGDDAGAAVATAAAAAGVALERLSLDGCVLHDAGAASVADACPRLEHLSLVGVSRLGNDGLTALAHGCAGLRSLVVGGMRGKWTDAALAAFCGLHTLRIVRRGSLYEAELADAVRGCGPNLRAVALAACGGVSDASLAMLAQAAPGLRSLTLTACDHRDLRGAPLRCFTRLRTLVVSSCPALQCISLVHALVACPDLLRMHVPIMMRQEHTPVHPPLEDEEDSGARPWRPRPLLHVDFTSSGN